MKTENLGSKQDKGILDKEKEKYPVQRVAIEGDVNEKEVEDAVQEINPDMETLERG